MIFRLVALCLNKLRYIVIRSYFVFRQNYESNVGIQTASLL
jgi:hypothetical protein